MDRTDRTARQVIAIDGPAAAGKSTVARAVARRLNGIYVDTGVIYRALALAVLRRGIDPASAHQIAALARRLAIDVEQPTIDDGRDADVRLDGEDVTWAIRAPEVDRIVSIVAAHREVREALLDLQRRAARSGRVVMAGRDVGTVVMPDAELKIWLDATLDERARRRLADLERRGVERTLEQVREELATRDRIDSERAAAPAVAACDAIVIDSSGRSVDSIVEQIVALAEDLADE